MGLPLIAALGDDGERSFSALSISGDTVVVRVHGSVAGKAGVNGKAVALKQRVLIDSMLVGFAEAEAAPAKTQAAAG